MREPQQQGWRLDRRPVALGDDHPLLCPHHSAARQRLHPSSTDLLVLLVTAHYAAMRHLRSLSAHPESSFATVWPTRNTTSTVDYYAAFYHIRHPCPMVSMRLNPWITPVLGIAQPLQSHETRTPTAVIITPRPCALELYCCFQPCALASPLYPYRPNICIATHFVILVLQTAVAPNHLAYRPPQATASPSILPAKLFA